MFTLLLLSSLQGLGKSNYVCFRKSCVRLIMNLPSIALLKLFIVAAYMSQSFYGISRGNNNNGINNGYSYSYRSIAERGCEGSNCYDGYGYYDSQPANGGSYGGYHDNNNGGDDSSTDVQLYCLWAGESWTYCRPTGSILT